MERKLGNRVYKKCKFQATVTEPIAHGIFCGNKTFFITISNVKQNKRLGGTVDETRDIKIVQSFSRLLIPNDSDVCLNIVGTCRIYSFASKNLSR